MVASTRSLTVPCSDRASHSHYGFAFHSRRNGNYSRSADIPCTGRTGDRLHRLPHRRPFRRSLIGLHYSAVRQRRLGLHRFDDSPLSPNDDAKHPNSQRGYTVLLPSRRPNPGGSISMLRSSGGGSHVIQANAPPFGVTLAGLFATPVSCGALAASPQSGPASEVLPTSSVRVRTRTGRIRPVEPPLAAPFLFRLSVSSLRLTRRSAAAALRIHV